MAVAALLAACGGEESSDSNERAGTYQLEVVDASFPSEQRLGQTSVMRLAVRHAGEETVPTVTVTVDIGGKRGSEAALPFAVHDPSEGIAQGDRPVWVLSARYPRFVGSSDSGGASTSNKKTYAFGALKPGRTATVIWKLSAVQAGDWTVDYRVGAGLGTQVKAETPDGGVPRGSFAAEISSELPEVEVTDDGEVLEIESDRKGDGA